jgi:hypothetical protein
VNENPRVYKKGSLVWPILLICLGSIFLLNNLGIVSWDVWMTIVRLWPLLLIVVGLDILLGRKPGVWSLITLFLVFGLFVAGAWLIQATNMVWAGEINTYSFSQSINGANRADVNIDFDIGDLEISRSPESGILMEGELDITENERLNQKYIIQDGIGFLELGSIGTQYYPSWIFNGWGEGHKDWMINLTDEIPLDLNIDTGAGQATIDLEGIHLEDLNVNSGIGETRVYLPSSGSFTAWISQGIGELIVYVPADLIVRIHLDSGLGSESISGNYVQSGDVYYSSDFDETGDWVELYVDGGIGDVRIIQVR